MKLLLSSGGITNKQIAQTLFELVGKRPEDTKLVFIPTASNVEMDDKSWFIDDLINIKKQNFKSITITDISAVPENIWRPQLEEADVLFFEGGQTYHLMDWINKSGLAKILPNLLKDKVYMGVSAGSMITAPDLNLKLSKVIYGENTKTDSMKGLGLVDFYFLPHLNSPHFSPRIETNLEEAMKEVTKKTYILDDQSAIKVTDGKIEIVGDGEYLEFN